MYSKFSSRRFIQAKIKICKRKFKTLKLTMSGSDLQMIFD